MSFVPQRLQKIPLFTRLSGDFVERLQKYRGVLRIVYLTLLPPRGLYFPVHPVSAKECQIFALCIPCAGLGINRGCPHSDEEREIFGVYTTGEVRLVVATGYNVSVPRAIKQAIVSLELY